MAVKQMESKVSLNTNFLKSNSVLEAFKSPKTKPNLDTLSLRESPVSCLGFFF